MTPDFPTRGYSFLVPSICEHELTGYAATILFARRGHTYSVRLTDNRMPRYSCEVERDGKRISLTAMPAQAREVAEKAAAWVRDNVWCAKEEG